MRTLAPLLLVLSLSPARADIVPPRPGLADIVPVKPDAPSGGAAGGFDVSPFPQRREIGEVTSGSGLFRIELDAESHQLGGADLSAFRLAKDEDGVFIEMPWVVRRVHGPETPRGPLRLTHRVESLDESPDGAVEITVTLDPDSPAPARLEIITPLRDFEKGVTVSIPDEGGRWIELVADGVVFDHSRFLDFRRTSILLPGTESRRFRIRIADATDEQRSLLREITRTVGDASGLVVSESSRIESRAFRIDEIRFFSSAVKRENGEEARRSIDLKLLEPASTEEGITEFVLDGGFFPIDRLSFSSDDRNFRRSVEVQVPSDGGLWRTLHRGHLHRYEVGHFRDESLGLAFPETRSDRYRIVIGNGNNPPVNLSRVTGSGPAYELVFIGEKGDRPVLFLGDPGGILKSPRLDTAAIEAALSTNVRPETLSLGESSANPAHRASSVPRTRLLESRTALWSMIAIAVAVLIWVLYGALKRIDGDGADPGSPNPGT